MINLKEHINQLEEQPDIVRIDEREFDLSGLKDKGMLIIFTKKDGTRREMRCTTNLKLIPSENHPKGTDDRKYKEGYYRVYDLDKEDWRSFNMSQIISVKNL